jgi:GH15 family glucan-1,4-alpha-glucosidase
MRTDGYAGIADYAAIGDGRAVGLVARDGSVDWLCLPNPDSPSVFGAVLDAEQGGRFALAPTVPFESERAYEPDTNVLQTTFRTAEGAARVTDALTLPGVGLEPGRELVRRIEGLAGTVPLEWIVQPRFDYGLDSGRIGTRNGVPVFDGGPVALGIRAWKAGDPEIQRDGVRGTFDVRDGERSLLVLAAAHLEPLVLPGCAEAERRLDDTSRFWRRWTSRLTYDGPWRQEVLRSVLVLKLLVHALSGAIAAAPTTSLPEVIGGERNWDYRFAWIRDAAFTIEALADVGADQEAHAFFWWLLQASQLTHPRLQALYRLDGGNRTPERTISLPGYRGSAPVRIGNDASKQRQLDVYGDLMQTAWLYVRGGGQLTGDGAKRLAGIADLVCEIWREPDSGIWEVRGEPRHFTHSKMMCFVALDRAFRLAEQGHIPARHAEKWRHEADAVRSYVEDRCFDPAHGTYVRFAGARELDASLLLAPIMEYCADDDERLAATIDAIRSRLARGPFLARYDGGDGLPGEEGAFLACSFWLVEALARAGRIDEAEETMETLLRHANDVGLYSEEIDPHTGDLLGNFPQALTHLALVSAASAVARRGR